jgi:hypothetical protein
MSSDEAARTRFAKAWAAAVERALPPLNIEQGASRLVSALRQREQGRSRSSSSRLVLWAAAAAITLSILMMASRIWIFEKPSLGLTIDGKQATTLAAIGGARAQLVHFSDGSRIALDPKSALDVAQADADRVAVTLKQGAANFDVVRSESSSWQIGAGPFQVRVLGTAFRVEWDADSRRFSLSVTRGAVRVSGPLLSGEQVISAGATCTVDLAVQRATFGTGATGVEPQAATRTESLGPGVAPDGDAEVRPTPNEAERRVAAVPTRSAARTEPPPQGALDWRELERQGQFDKAIQEAMRAGVDEIYARASAQDLMGLARAARLAGRLDISGAALLSCRRRFAGTPDAAMAAYLLGRNAAPAEAARWFSTYLSEQPDGSLAREASGRLMEAHFRSGLREAARADARAYLLRYPSGPHADFAKMVLSR